MRIMRIVRGDPRHLGGGRPRIALMPLAMDRRPVALSPWPSD